MGNKDTKTTYFNNIRTNTKGAVYSTHTRFLDIPRCDKINAEIEGCINDEVHQPKAHITHRRVESLSHLGRLNGISRFNKLFWPKKASASESFTCSEVASSEKTPSSGHYREDDSDYNLRALTTARTRKEKFRSISLPVEIREMLYDFILFKSPPKKKRSARQKPAFLRAFKYYGSKDLHEETKIAFYSINTFSYSIVGKAFKMVDDSVRKLFRSLVLDIPNTTLLTPLSTQISVLYTSLDHLTLCSHSLVGLHTFVKSLLPNFKALRSLSVEIVRGVNTDEVRSFLSASESCKNLLNKMVSGENGEGIKGVITKNEVHSDVEHSVRAGFA